MNANTLSSFTIPRLSGRAGGSALHSRVKERKESPSIGEKKRRGTVLCTKKWKKFWFVEFKIDRKHSCYREEQKKTEEEMQETIL